MRLRSPGGARTTKLGVAAAVFLLVCLAAAVVFELLFELAPGPSGAPPQTTVDLWLVSLSGLVAIVVTLLVHRIGLERDRYEAVIANDALDRRPGEDAAGEWEGGKTALVSAVSHELHTPLTMIQGYAELLLTRRLEEPETREALEQISSSAGRLSRLVDDVLSVARIESGGVAVRIAPVDVAEVLEDAVDPFRQREPWRPFQQDLAEELPLVLADRDKLHQVLTNLLSNAVKYSAESAPVSVYARRHGTAVEIGVEDGGIGLGEHERSRIFDKFFRSDREEVQGADGTGLGLYVARRFVEMQGGQLEVSSELGKGARFFFRLPLVVSGTRDDHSATALT